MKTRIEFDSSFDLSKWRHDEIALRMVSAIRRRFPECAGELLEINGVARVCAGIRHEGYFITTRVRCDIEREDCRLAVEVAVDRVGWAAVAFAANDYKDQYGKWPWEPKFSVEVDRCTPEDARRISERINNQLATPDAG